MCLCQNVIVRTCIFHLGIYLELTFLLGKRRRKESRDKFLLKILEKVSENLTKKKVSSDPHLWKLDPTCLLHQTLEMKTVGSVCQSLPR